MKTLNVCLISLVLMGCGPHPVSIDPEFQVYYDRFEAETAITPRIDIRFTDNLPEGINGNCFVSPTQRLITISRVRWAKMDDDTRELLVVHELGHCQLNRVHLNDMLGNRPQSVMHKYLFSGWLFKEYRKEYYQELIHPNP